MKVIDQVEGNGWVAYQADCADALRGIPSDSVDYVAYSPPFLSLFAYSPSPRDMSNCRSDDQFFDHYRFLARELYRVTRPGRLMSQHCMLMPSSKAREGFIGLKDFRGDLIRACQAEGWIFHSEVSIYKSPVVAAQRTKALGLLYKQLQKDSAMSRQGIADFLVTMIKPPRGGVEPIDSTEDLIRALVYMLPANMCTMRKPGENASPISHTKEDFPLPVWQRYAEPVWMDIDQSDTLQFRSAKEPDDQRHLCPTQLAVMRRAVKMWSNPGDVVLTPFGGVGTEAYVALEMGRKAIAVELKGSYFKQLVANLRSVEPGAQKQQSLFTTTDAA